MFDGAIHDEISLEIGTNRDDRKVVRMVLDPFRTVSIVHILSLDAAVFIRDRLNQILRETGLDDKDLVPGMHCPGISCNGYLGGKNEADGFYLVCPECGLEWDEGDESVAT